jgi:hypothetical protein
MLGNEGEVSRLADEVAKRGKQGQQNPAGARTSGLRRDEQRHRAAHRGGKPGRRTRVSKAGANAPRSAGMSGIRLKRGAGVAEGSRPNCVVPELEAVLGKTHRTEF